MASKTATFNPSGYDTSNTSTGTISNISNAYTNSASTTYAIISANTTQNGTSYIAFTFDITSIPSTATIDSVVCYTKGAVNNTSSNRTSTFVAQLYNGTTAMGSSVSIGRVTTATAANITSTGTWTRDTLDNLELRFTHTRGSSSNAVAMLIYGADLVITYTTVDNVTITTTISNGVLVSPTTASMEVEKGSSATLTFSGNTDQVFKSMTVDGTEVTPIWNEGAGTVTMTASTNTDEYTTDSNGIDAICDGDASTYYWTQQGQAVGDYMLITLSAPVYLKGVSSVCTKSATDYFKSNCQLQISSNGSDWTTVGTCADSSSQSFTDINQTCQYVRFYITAATTSWWCVNEITLDYVTDGYYSYTIDSVDANTTVAIVFGPDGPTVYVKNSKGVWKQSSKVYQKTSTGWVVVSTTDFQSSASSGTYKFILGENPYYNPDAIGSVTSNTNDINLNSDALESGTYTLYYEDSTNTPLDGWNPIGEITI